MLRRMRSVFGGDHRPPAPSVSERCRRHRISPRFPPEPPALAHPLGERWRRRGSVLPLGEPKRASADAGLQTTVRRA